MAGIAAGDLDGDGLPELVFGAGNNGLSPDLLLAWDFAAAEFEVSSLDDDGPDDGFAAGDVDADDTPELITSLRTTGSGTAGGLVVVRDAVGHGVELSIHLPGISNRACESPSPSSTGTPPSRSP